MLHLLKQSFARARARWRGELGDKPLIDREAVEKMLERSRVPAVLMLVMAWTVAAVVLILSGNRQYKELDWIDGQKAPYSIFAKIDFEYVDEVATESKREEARRSIPKYYRREIDYTLARVDGFFREIDEKVSQIAAADAPADASAKKTDSAAAAPAKPAVAAPEHKIKPFYAALVAAYHRKDDYRKFRERLESMLKRGITPDRNEDALLRIVGREGDIKAESLGSIGDCTEELARQLLPTGAESHKAELKMLLKDLIGKQGNLICDEAATETARRKAADAVLPVVVSREKDDCLIHKGDPITPEIRRTIIAEREKNRSAKWSNVWRQVGWSIFVMLGGVVCIYFFSKDIRRNNLRILLAGLTISAALALNYCSMWYFEYLLRESETLQDMRLIQAAVPVAFCAVVLAVVLDLRTAICAGGLVAVISALMVLPHRSLELALVWTVIGSAAALAVHKVGNYRSFFVRTLLAVLVMTWATNWYLVFLRDKAEPSVFNLAFWTILANAVVCAVLSLLMVFVLELLFNLSTDMALMVLSDCNHPVLERLKREAGGTMAHSMAVATLAEDGAKAIGANPVRAKAGALFHDIGKLSNPQYFTENNPKSSLLHDSIAPQMSSRIIRDHVTEGVALARRHRLCRFIREVIASHHGNDLVQFFYNKALEESKKSGAKVLERQFRYGGPLPVNREAGIICLADACEAASRSIKDPTEEKIADKVADIFRKRFDHGMLCKCHLTAEELDKLQKSFIRSLSTSMHGRIAYPAEPADSGRSGKC